MIDYLDPPSRLPAAPSDCDNSDEPAGPPYAENDIWTSVCEWAESCSADVSRMISLLIFEIYRQETQVGKVAIAEKVGSIVGKSGRTIRDWRSKFISNAGEFPDSMRGRYARDSIIDHEDCRVKPRNGCA